MFALVVFIYAAVLLVPAFAAEDSSFFLWSAVAFVRAGDRTPSVGTQSTTLTPLGAQQLFSVGSFFRSRYIDGQVLAGLDETVADDSQVYALANDEQYTVASAQAFMQGLYPPTSSVLEDTILANGTSVEGPLGGLTFARISTAGSGDPNMIYVAGNQECPALDYYTENGIDFMLFTDIEESSQPVYNSISYLLDDIMPVTQQNYYNAWAIYDYINYLYTYNATAAAELDKLNVMTQLRTLADSQQSAYYGNLEAQNIYGRIPELASTGGISTIAGASAASLALSSLTKVAEQSQDAYPLSLIFGDYEPMLSLFALAGLTSPDFAGLPMYGSALVFELYSTKSTVGIPQVADLLVRFSFRNGTDASEDGLQTFPIFGRTAAEGDMPYLDFVMAMDTIAIANPGDWCQQCGSASILCAPYNISDTVLNGNQGSDQPSGSVFEAPAKNRGLSNAVVGIIGAMIGLVVASVVGILVLLVGGLRLKRTEAGLTTARRLFPRRNGQKSLWCAQHSSTSALSLAGQAAPMYGYAYSEKSVNAHTRPISRPESSCTNTSGVSGVSREEIEAYRQMGQTIQKPKRVSPNTTRFPVRRSNSDRSDRSDRSVRSVRSGHSDRSGRSERSGRSDRHGRNYPLGAWSNYSD